MLRSIYLIVVSFLLVNCANRDSKDDNESLYTDGATTLFTKIDGTQSGIPFKNMVREDMEFNFLNYPYLYTGAGVATGDIDKDGYIDVYLTSNFGPNKLYKNNGDFTFTDITFASKTEDFDGFATGTTMLDVNNDGWLDIYVAKAGSMDNDDGRRNKLFVNQQDGTFKEQAAQWGLDDPGYSTQAYSLDYDKDGDLDLYVVNYRYDFKNNTKISGTLQSQIEETTSDQLYRNDGQSFTKVTAQAGLYNKAWGLSGAVGDFNMDGWDDIYVSNDYLEPDMMYINQKDGTFRLETNSRFNHISFNSMGSDYADLNNDRLPDLITVDMLAENYARSKENMASMSTSNFMKLVEIGYHHAYMANMLHYNEGNGKFKETAQLSGVVKTDWSWAPLIADFDNDGLKDIFISNGVYKDYNNQDFRIALRKKNAAGESMTLQAVLDMMPSQKLDNYVYKNNGDLTFTKVIKEWGLEDPSFSNGAAYADFDNDGDLDLLVNNVNDHIGLYRNNSNANNYLQLNLEGPATNKLAIGTSVLVKTGDVEQYQKLYLTRGFESSVPQVLHFGLGDKSTIDELIVQWPDGKTTLKKGVDVNKQHTISYADATDTSYAMHTLSRKKKPISPEALGFDYIHKENTFNDYSLQLLIPQKQSSKGTHIAKGDVNGDGLEDIFIGNASGAEAALYIQNAEGKFTATNTALWSREKAYEDANAVFFDADGDGDQDLYVVSAGYELEENNTLLQDRLYLNDGKGNMSRSNNALPKMLTSGQALTVGDFDKDGDMDVFVGGNVVSQKYPLSPQSYLLQNNNGKFSDVTLATLQDNKLGMTSDALFTDYDGDNDLDLLLVGEWMKPTIFKNNNGSFQTLDAPGLEKTEGWWFSISSGDFDNDGDLDYVFGNVGKNNKFQPKKEKPIYIYGKDFDDNGSFDVALSKINEGKLVPVRGKECSSEQNPFLLEKIGTYNEFASLEMKDIYGEDKLKDAYQLTAHTFETMYAENVGNGDFKMHKLATVAQTGPTLSIVSDDFNGDGNLDIMGVGAIYDAEVETIRYDSNYGYVLLGDGKGGFTEDRSLSPFIDKDAKDIKKVTVGNKSHFVVVSNNAPLEIFTLNP